MAAPRALCEPADSHPPRRTTGRRSPPSRIRRPLARPAGIERIGGLTNRNYKVTIGAETLRAAHRRRRHRRLHRPPAEEHNARVAAAAGVNAEVLFFDADDGRMLCRFVEADHDDVRALSRPRTGRAGGARVPAHARVAGAVREPLRRVRQDRRVSGAAAPQPGAHPRRLRRAAADRERRAPRWRRARRRSRPATTTRWPRTSSTPASAW